MADRLKPREQGDIGERAAVEWLWSQGAAVFIPFGHSPDYDLAADLGGRLVRVQVKTTTQRIANGRYALMICTRGGNQSWNGLAKYFSPSRCDYLFVLTGNGRQFFIPAQAVEARSGMAVGGPKYAAYEVESRRPFVVSEAA